MIDCDWCRDPIDGEPARRPDRGRPVHPGDCATHAAEHDAVYARARARAAGRGLVPDLVIVDDPLPAQAEIDELLEPYRRGGLVGPGGPGLALVHPGELYLAAPRQAELKAPLEQLAAIRPVPMPGDQRDRLRRQIARAFDVPFVDVDQAAMRAELGLRDLEPARWADDGGRFDDPLDLPPLVVEIRPDVSRFLEAMTEAGQRMLDGFRQLADAFMSAGRRLGSLLGLGPASLAARRWVGDVPPRRWRDWLPAAERKVDRARRERLDRQLRTLERRAARRRRIRARKAAGWYAIGAAGRHGAAALDVLHTAAAGAR